MRDFFKGWRRKVGVVALAVACGLMVESLLIREYNAESWKDFERSKQSIRHEFKPDGSVVLDYGPRAVHVLRRFSFVPYLAVILPLTILSANLLLWPRRKREKHPQTPTVIQSPQE